MKLTQRIYTIIIILIISFVCNTVVFCEVENLDERIARKSRYASAIVGKDYLEDTSSYVWQPETLCYNDIVTGNEVWVVVQGADEQSIFSKEYATEAWSYDGSTLGVFIKRDDRSTNNPNIKNTGYYQRWLVKSTGAYLKAATGYSAGGIPEGGFGWAHTENAYYGFGMHSSWDAPTSSLCKLVVGSQNKITSSEIILNTSTAAGGDMSYGFAGVTKGLIKRPISADDQWLSCSARSVSDYGTNINSNGHMRIKLNGGVNPTINDYWGINRQITDVGGHSPACETKAHGGGNWTFGFDQEYSIMQYTGCVSNEKAFFKLKSTGTATDGGPKWEVWDGDSYGANEVYPLTGAAKYLPEPDGFHHIYLNHPSFGRWEKYMLNGSGDPYPGTVIVEIANGNAFDGNHGYLSDDISEKAQYDGRHHAWDSWSDTVIFFPAYINDVGNNGDLMYGRTINFITGTRSDALAIVSTHPPESISNYSAHPRPSQSPDGTKVAFAATWLNNEGSNHPYLNYAVVYYPYPPEITSCSTISGAVKLRFDWQNTLADPNPRTYTTRGWPNEATDDRPIPREINKYRIWRSTDKEYWTPIKTIDADHFERFDFANGGFKAGKNSYWEITDTPGNGTFYYGVTSIEHSGLESRTLSNVFSITVTDVSVTGSQEVAYPEDPGGDSDFYDYLSPAELPKAPSGLTIDSTKKSSGHYRLSWTEPADNALIRYYNIYYSTINEPYPRQKYRIASVPVGTTTWLDWCADKTKDGKYKVTSVDTQGNETDVFRMRMKGKDCEPCE